MVVYAFFREEMSKMENINRNMTLKDAFKLYDAKQISAEELLILAYDIKDSSQSENLVNYNDNEKKQPVRTLK